MKITIKQLIIKNFKGIKSLIIDFNNITNIEGANRAGKTTIFDAMNYLLFGKNAEDKKDFQIKPTTPDGAIIPKLENEVFAVLDIDGREMKLKRTQREKWVKKHGESETVLTGNETIYEIGEAPIKQSDFNTKISNLVNEDLFKLVTNPLYFNSLHWEKRREMLIGLTVQKSDIDILNGMKSPSADLLKMLNEQKTIEEIKKELSGKIKRLKDELKLIPVRIDEVTTSKAEVKDFDALEIELKTKQAELQTIENLMTNKSKALTDFNNSRIEELKRVNLLQRELTEFIFHFETKENTTENAILLSIQDKEAEKQKIESNISNTIQKIDSLRQAIKDDENVKGVLLREYHKINAETFIFDENDTKCKTCLQELPNIENKKAEFETNFNTNKKKELDKFLTKGLELKNIIERKTKDLAEFESILEQLKNGVLTTLESEIKELRKQVAALKPASYETDAEYIKINKIHTDAKTRFEAVEAPKVDKTELLNDKSFKLSEIEQINVQLRVKDQIETAEKRIKELETEEKTKAGLLVSLEKTEFEVDNFTKHKMTSIESEINKMFTLVKFRMFESQINGGEKESCVCLFNGVPYSDTNSEGQINGGLDIINTFSKFYDIYAPIFIDNREGVTELIEINTQLINLYVNPKHKTLKIT